MSRSPLNGWDSAFIGPLAVCVNQYFNLLIGEHVLLWLFLVSTRVHCLKMALDCFDLDLQSLRSSSIQWQSVPRTL